MIRDVVAMANQKGGVGKTTTTQHLARAAQHAGLRTLVIDLDPQGHLTSTLAADAESLPANVAGTADVLAEQGDIADLVIESRFDGVALLPTKGENLVMVSKMLVGAPLGKEHRLRRALAKVENDYDLVLLDCQPELGDLMVNALVAATKVVVVTDPDYYAANGIARLLSHVSLVRDHCQRPDLEVTGVVLNKFSKAQTTHEYYRTEISAALPLLDPPMPEWASIRKARDQGIGLDQYPDPRARTASENYASYLRQILKGAKK